MDPTKGNQYVRAPTPAPASLPPSVMGIPMNPASQMTQSQGPVLWSTGLCDCTEDVGNCCMTCWCPCVTFGRIADIVDRGSTSCGASGALYALITVLTSCHCIYSCFYRSKLRAQYNLPESPCPDILVHCCCEECALCQSYRELKNHGFDMTIGWYLNMERRGHAITQPPPIQGGMMR